MGLFRSTLEEFEIADKFYILSDAVMEAVVFGESQLLCSYYWRTIINDSVLHEYTRIKFHEVQRVCDDSKTLHEAEQDINLLN